jgi:capsular polysaccharide biosynthesis protein
VSQTQSLPDIELSLAEPGDIGVPLLAYAPALAQAPEESRIWMSGRIGGGPAPSWADGSEGTWWSDEAVWRIDSGWWWPIEGAVSDQYGHVFRPTIGRPRTTTPGIADLPYVRIAPSGVACFAPPADALTLTAASVFMSWGGGFNYGHFILDSLTSLMLLDEAGQLDDLPAVAPSLKRWHRELLHLTIRDRLVREVKAKAIRLGKVAFANPMDHFIHHPNRVIDRLRTRILSNTPPAHGPKRLYLSRRGWSMRVMVNEAELEAALAARGFVSVHLERLSVPRQVALMRGAEVVVAPTGAALANTLFCSPTTRVFEIQPDGFYSGWVRALRHVTGGEWFGWFTPAPIDPREAPLLARMRRGFRFAYRTQIQAFLTFLDERL